MRFTYYSHYRGVEVSRAEDGSCRCMLDGKEKTAPNYKTMCDRIRSHQWHATRRAQAEPLTREEVLEEVDARR